MNDVMDENGRNYDWQILEQRATLPALRISDSFHDTFFIVAPYCEGQALYSALHDKPLSTTLLAWAQPCKLSDCEYEVHAATLRHIRVRDQALVRGSSSLGIYSTLCEAQRFVAEYINKRYEAVCDLASNLAEIESVPRLS